MSVDRCHKCDRLVDTDYDPECYYDDDDMRETPCTCAVCRGCLNKTALDAIVELYSRKDSD